MHETGVSEAWRLERYQPGLETGVLELFTLVFGKARSLEHWHWQFRDNPYGGPFVSTVRRATDGLVVASYSVMPLQLNFAGRAVRACQSVDTAVHPEFRGQRMFEKTASDCYRWCADEGLQAVVGFPNANSYPGFVRSLDWKRIVFPTQHTLRLSLATGLRRVLRMGVLAAFVDVFHRARVRLALAMRHAFLRRLVRRDVAFATASEVPDGYEALWNAWRAQEVLSLWKDSAYFRWRYDRNPDRRFEYLYLADAGGISALAVATEIDGSLVLCELMVRDRDVAMGRLLVNRIAVRAAQRGLRAVTFLAHDCGFFADVLAGFEHTLSYTNVFGGRAFVAGALAETLPLAGNWTITFGDGDFV
jgi:hypothetical protein